MIFIKAQGFINEEDFVKNFNNKVFEQLKFNEQLFIENIYPNIKKNDKIKANLGNGKEKTDFTIIINNIDFKMSLKMGHKNSVHVENVFDFATNMVNNGISHNNKENYLRYHFGDGTKKGKGDTRLGAKELLKKYEYHLYALNKELNNDFYKKYIIKKSIIGDPEIDYLIYGTTKDFVWISKEEIFDLIMNYEFNTIKRTPHISKLTIQPMNRCLNYNPKYNKFRYFVQIKWYNIFDDILEYKYTHKKNLLF